MTTLPPAGSSASVARRLVESALIDSPMRHRLDEALLLVTEIVTNAIVHAGTELDLHLDVEPDSIRVEVIDKTPGVLRTIQEPAETREGGRGLLLLDALATEWGTRHFGWGKSVWFVLGGSEHGEPHTHPAPTPEPPRRNTDIHWLVELPEDVERQLSPAQLIGELLHRLADGLQLETCCAYAQSADDERQWEVVACNDPTATHDIDAIRRATQANLRSLPGSGLALLPLHGSSGVIGTIAFLRSDELTAEEAALARLVAERISVVLRDDRAQKAELRNRGSLALLAEASEMFAGTLDVQLGMTLAAQLVVPRFARWSAVWDICERVPRLMAVAHADEARLDALQTALSDFAGETTALHLVGHLTEHRPKLLAGSELPAQLAEERSGEMLVLPLVARRRLVGMLAVGRPPGRIFGADDVGLLNDLARRTAVAVDSARLYEESTSIARALQASLLPPTLPRSKVLEFGARYAAAGEGNEVGGDFYDVFELPDEGWGIAIGDVCGKGAEAAAITGMVRDILRLLVRDGHKPPSALRRLNDAILELGERGRFCTATLGTVRQDGDCLLISLSSAGHPPPVLVRSNGTVRFVGRSGTLLGVLDDVELSEDTVLLQPGDALVFYTDGVTERRRGDAMFGEYNLLDCLRGSPHRSADAIAGLLEERVQHFGVARDDLAVLVVRCTEQPTGNGRPDSHVSVAVV